MAHDYPRPATPSTRYPSTLLSPLFMIASHTFNHAFIVTTPLTHFVHLGVLCHVLDKLIGNPSYNISQRYGV